MLYRQPEQHAGTNPWLRLAFPLLDLAGVSSSLVAYWLLVGDNGIIYLGVISGLYSIIPY